MEKGSGCFLKKEKSVNLEQKKVDGRYNCPENMSEWPGNTVSLVTTVETEDSVRFT